MIVRDYQAGDENEILKLFEIAFNQSMSPEQWHWRFSNNPAGKHFIKLMWENDLLIGHYAVSPILMSVENEIILAAHSLTTMTHPEHTGKGIFNKLSLELYDDLENNKNVKLIWGFPNNNSHYGFIKNLKWKDITVIHTLAAKATIFRPKLNGEFSEFVEFDSIHEIFIEKKLSTYPIKVNRNLQYLNWRYNDKPSVKYRKFGKFNNDDSSLIVTKLYPSQKNGYFDLNIIELFIDNITDLRVLLEHVLACYNEKIDRITIWKNLHDPNHIFLEKMGFYPDLPQTYLGARPHTSIAERILNNRNWYYSFGDSDVF